MPKPSRRKRRAVRERVDRRAAHKAREAANLLRAGIHHAPPVQRNRVEMDLHIAAGALSVGDPVILDGLPARIRRLPPGASARVIGVVKSIHNKIPGPSTATVVLK